MVDLNKTAENVLHFVERKLWVCIIFHLMYHVQFAQCLQLEFDRVITYDYATPHCSRQVRRSVAIVVRSVECIVKKK